jgi:hypothetical protein
MTDHHAEQNHHLCLSLTWRDGTLPTQAEAFWDQLNSWCWQRAAYLGGSTAQAFVLVTTRQASTLEAQLRRRLQRNTLIASYQLTLVTWDAVPCANSPARLESLAHYQQHLLEQLQWSVQAMPVLLCAGSLGL